MTISTSIRATVFVVQRGCISCGETERNHTGKNIFWPVDNYVPVRWCGRCGGSLLASERITVYIDPPVKDDDWPPEKRPGRPSNFEVARRAREKERLAREANLG